MGVNPALLEARAERYRQVLEMRSAGASWGDIGKRFGISRTVARRTWQRAQAEIALSSPTQVSGASVTSLTIPFTLPTAPIPAGAWWLSEAGIHARGAALGVGKLPNETLEDYKDRLLWNSA